MLIIFKGCVFSFTQISPPYVIIREEVGETSHILKRYTPFIFAPYFLDYNYESKEIMAFKVER